MRHLGSHIGKSVLFDLLAHRINLKSSTACLLMALAVSSFLFSCASSLEFGNPEAKIAFASTREGNRDIYVINLDGSGETRLTDDPAWDWHPAWSPDGRRIAFESNRDGDFEIYVMNADGSGLTQLTDNFHQDRAPSWSPGGSRIAFQQQRHGGSVDIYVMNTDGSKIVRLTHDDDDESDPNWSPDGQRMSFSGSGSIFGHSKRVINPAGTDLELISFGAIGASISWSPSGGSVLYDRFVGRNREIFFQQLDGLLDAKRLTDNPGHDASPTWSPDGLHIAFESNRDGNLEIYVMNADGSGAKRLTINSYSDVSPSWQPGQSD